MLLLTVLIWIDALIALKLEKYFKTELHELSLIGKTFYELKKNLKKLVFTPQMLSNVHLKMFETQQFPYGPTNTNQSNFVGCCQSKSQGTANNLPVSSGQQQSDAPKINISIGAQHRTEIIINRMEIKTNNRKVQIFEYALRRLAFMGLKPNERLLNGRVLRHALVYSSMICTGVMYVILEANTFSKYITSIFNTITAVYFLY